MRGDRDREEEEGGVRGDRGEGIGRKRRGDERG